ncbi:MAG: electron transport complex subunit RsxE, partial [Oscillospiraceae bacterium]
MKKSAMKTFLNGIFGENPTFVLFLGMCPTLAVTTGVVNAIGMGLSTMVVLICSNIVISMLRNFIPDKIRIAGYVVIIAGFVTIIQMLLNAYVPALASSLGIYIPLIVVNCIILGRAEAFANKNGVFQSAVDGLGMGLGFTLSLTLIGSVREI